MKDIVESLRNWHEKNIYDCIRDLRLAANEIERLRAELKDAKARNTLYLSKIQEYEVREI